MLTNKAKRLAELERQIGARHKQATNLRLEAIRAQLSRDDLAAVDASLERREQPGYQLTPEDRAIEQRWVEVVRAVLPKSEMVSVGLLDWALAWCEAVKNHG